MPRPAPTRLREQRAAAPAKAPVIEATFKVVGRRTWLSRIWRGFLALCAAAAIGFLIPPLWVFVQSVGAMLGR